MELSVAAVRVLGCLVEKLFTTPEQYPMSVNGIVGACNQSTNRQPVMQLSERDVHGALDELRTEHRLVRMIHAGAGSRVDKFRQSLDERLGLTPPEMVVLAMLALRGPQTVAEVKARTERMIDMSADHIERVVSRLCDPTLGADPDEFTARSTDGMMRTGLTGVTAEIPDGHARPWASALVVRLPRQPGQKEPRVAQVLQGLTDIDALAASANTGSAAYGADSPRTNSATRASSADQLAALEARVTELDAAFRALEQRFDDFRRQF